jgi:peptidoglycan/xylan/chitin deacetylase (PgdA/CDA1 family)
MDHPHYDYSPLPARAGWRWPGGAGLAFGVIVVLESVEADPEATPLGEPSAGVGPRPHPNYSMLAHREYGHRVGVFRLLDVLEKHGIRPSVAMDVMTAEEYPALVEHCARRGAEFLAHGLAANRPVSGHLSPAEEDDYIASSLRRLEAATGQPVQGWLSPGYRESARTPRALAAAGVTYLCDWGNDDQPYAMTVGRGVMCAVPAAVEYDDAHALWGRRMPTAAYADMVVRGCRTLVEESATAPRSVVVVLRPWLSGQPFRIDLLDRAFGDVVGQEGVWPASTGDIATAWRERTS